MTDADNGALRCELIADDQQPLISYRFTAQGAPRGSVVIAPAMGVPQSFYAQVANWLARRGYHVNTFDYRGIGESAPQRLAGFAASIRDWAERDCAAVLNAAQNAAPADLPLFWIGHSLGGQILGLLPNRANIDKAITVASGNGYWRQLASRQRLRSLALWYGLVPFANTLFGYFPGKRIGAIGNIPRQAMGQWRQWCLSPRYLFDVEGEKVQAQYADIRFPITALSFDDDEMMTKAGIDHIHRFFVNAPVVHHHLAPRAVGVQRIGHFGFFRERLCAPLWQDYLQAELAIDATPSAA